MCERLRTEWEDVSYQHPEAARGSDLLPLTRRCHERAIEADSSSRIVAGPQMLVSGCHENTNLQGLELPHKCVQNLCPLFFF